MLPWVTFIILTLSFCLNGVCEARHRKHLPTPTYLVGTVYCDTCFHQEFSKPAHFISGASVAVECSGAPASGSKPTFRQEAKTDEKGEFRVKLPFSVSKHVNKIKGCSVKLISSNQPYCAVASAPTSSTIRRKPAKQPGTHIFSAGFFTFKPLKQPELCNQKPATTNSAAFPPALPDPPAPFLPPIGEGILPPMPLPDMPNLPPLVPNLPRLPVIPIPPATKSESDDLSNQKSFGFPFPPNPFQPPVIPPLPFQPPPSILPPLPFQPPPPSLIPPLIPSPPPASLFPPLPFPPVPGFFPSPPPPPPAFPIPLPPLPPVPGFPTIPLPPPSSAPNLKQISP